MPAGSEPLTDFTRCSLRDLGIERVPVRKDPKTGFRVGGKNPTALIRTLTEMHGRKIEKLELLMRPGGMSTAGFLGARERLLDVMAADNRTVVEELGLTHQLLARHLNVLGAIGYRQWKEKVWNDQKRKWSDPATFVYHDCRFRVRITQYRGWQDSPFGDDTRASAEATVRNLDNRRRLTYSLLVPHMIERYGFYEGKGTRYRVEPRKVIEVLDFLKKNPKRRSPTGPAFVSDLSSAAALP
jgi:hypothetical protein